MTSGGLAGTKNWRAVETIENKKWKKKSDIQVAGNYDQQYNGLLARQKALGQFLALRQNKARGDWLLPDSDSRQQREWVQANFL